MPAEIRTTARIVNWDHSSAHGPIPANASSASPVSTTLMWMIASVVHLEKDAALEFKLVRNRAPKCGVMDRHASERIDHGEACLAADSLRRDFNQLIRIFDASFARLPNTDAEMRSHVSDAKLAAERGRKLSEDLIELLRVPPEPRSR
jgi:hypothetical protein